MALHRAQDREGSMNADSGLATVLTNRGGGTIRNEIDLDPASKNTVRNEIDLDRR
jgi:hypothetical protein